MPTSSVSLHENLNSMKKKEVIYYNEGGQRVAEKLMIMSKVNGEVSIAEAKYNTLSANMPEIYHWAVQGKDVYDGWVKVFETENVYEDLISIIRRAKDTRDCVASIVEKYNISEVSAEALADLTLYQITGTTIDYIKECQEYYSLAVEQLKPLMQK